MTRTKYSLSIRTQGSSCRHRAIMRIVHQDGREPITVTALGTPLTAGAFVIASEPDEPAAVGTRRLRAALRAAPNGLICTPCDDGARPRKGANIRRYVRECAGWCLDEC